MEQLVQKYCNSFKGELVKLISERGQRASGRLQSSIEVVRVNEFRYQVIGDSYFWFIIKGRQPTSQSKRGRLAGIIKNWIEDKGLNLNPFAVAAKIDREGIKVPNQFNDGRLFIQTFERSKIENLQNEIGDYYVELISNYINDNK